jgi:hypothetical protein
MLHLLRNAKLLARGARLREAALPHPCIGWPKAAYNDS